jgi:tetratricopeptide (TPR) repeat protein
MLKNDVVRLVKTLSTTEKRYFKLNCKKQSGDRAYLSLFDIIDQTQFKDIEQLEDKFKLSNPKASFETTANYLLRIVTDSLVNARADKDSPFEQMQSYMRAKVLFDRSLINEGFKELKKMQRSASVTQNHLMEYMACREELLMLSTLNFPNVDDKQVIDMQMKSKSTLKTLLQVHDHNSLFDLLKIRLINTGKTTSELAKRNLNDLLLSELSLVTSKVAYNFESTKLHLMFQSFFFTSIGDYKSALKTFSELNTLFELNIEKPSASPADYLSSLEGILDSLRTIRAYTEMPFYINKINSLFHVKNTEQFNQRIIKAAVTFQLNYLIGTNKFKEALEFTVYNNNLLFNETVITDYERHCELLFYCCLAHYGKGEFEKALKYINRITMLGKANYRFTIYKAAKLLGILIRYELGDIDYIHYEIRAYKRLSRTKGEVLRIEKLIFKIVMLDPNNNSLVKNKLLLKKIEPGMKDILNDKYELQVLKFYDFLNWIDVKLTTSRIKIKHAAKNLIS